MTGWIISIRVWSNQLLLEEYAHNFLLSSTTGLTFLCAYGYHPPHPIPRSQMEKEITVPSVQSLLQHLVEGLLGAH